LKERVDGTVRFATGAVLWVKSATCLVDLVLMTRPNRNSSFGKSFSGFLGGNLSGAKLDLNKRETTRQDYFLSLTSTKRLNIFFWN
jgi:hypothetical protein